MERAEHSGAREPIARHQRRGVARRAAVRTAPVETGAVRRNRLAVEQDNGCVTEPVRITIRVHPGASRTRIGGLHAEPGQEHVVGIWVSQRAVDGKATEAALAALADALGVRRRSVRLVLGERSRVKVVEVANPPTDLAKRLAGDVGP